LVSLLVSLQKGFGAQSASLPSGSVNTKKHRLVEVEGIFVNNTDARHLRLKSAPPTLRQQNEVGFFWLYRFCAPPTTLSLERAKHAILLMLKGYPQPLLRRCYEGLAFWRAKEALNQRCVSMHQPVEKFPQTRRATRWVAKPSANPITETG